MISPLNFIPSETKQPRLEAGQPRGATRFAAGLFCLGLDREMIYLGGKIVVGLFRFAFPRFIGSILSSLSRRKQKCLLIRPRSAQVPWLHENQPFSPAVPGMAREWREAPTTRLGKSYHRETVQGRRGRFPSRRIQGSFISEFNERASVPWTEPGRTGTAALEPRDV